MSLAFTAMTFLIVWWTVLFAVLPVGIRHQEKPGALDYAAAPARVDWKRKCLVTTAISAAITLALHVALASGLLPLRQWLDTM